MAEKRQNSAFVSIVLIIIFALMLAILSGKLFRSQINDIQNGGRNQGALGVLTIEWEKEFPFEKTIVNQYPYKNKESITKISYYSEKARKFESLGNNWLKGAYKYDSISGLGKMIFSFISDPTVSSGGYTQLNDGYWISPEKKKEYADVLDSYANYYNLKLYLDSKDIPFMFCYAPFKECVDDAKELGGVKSYTNYNIDLNISALDELHIPVIDFREYIHADKKNHHSLFYKTDHHWNSEAGLWATSIVEEQLNERFNFHFQDANSFGAYSDLIFENAQFGSAGRTVTHAVADSEDLNLLIPDFQTNFRVEIPDRDLDITGSFSEVFVDYEGMAYAQKSNGGYAYEQVLYGNRPYVKITNLMNRTAPKVLIIRDSYSLVVAPYLAASCSEIILIDPRYFTGSIVSCIDDFNPDVVLSLQCSPNKFRINK